MEFEFVLSIICIIIVSYILILIVFLKFWTHFKKEIFVNYDKDSKSGLSLTKEDNKMPSNESIPETKSDEIGLNKERNGCYGKPTHRQECLDPESNSSKVSLRGQESLEISPTEMDESQKQAHNRETNSSPQTFMNIEIEKPPVQTSKQKSSDSQELIIVNSNKREIIKENPKKDTEQKSNDRENSSLIETPVISPIVSSENKPKDKDIDGLNDSEDKKKNKIKDQVNHSIVSINKPKDIDPDISDIDDEEYKLVYIK